MIPLEREPEDLGGVEHCCFCRKRTPMWTTLARRVPGDQVACCEACASKYRIRDVPTKRYWCEKEDQIAKRYLIDTYPGYYLVDKQGRLRMGDVFDFELQDAIEMLLEEETS
jgi:hypothetical protein